MRGSTSPQAVQTEAVAACSTEGAALPALRHLCSTSPLQQYQASMRIYFVVRGVAAVLPCTHDWLAAATRPAELEAQTGIAEKTIAEFIVDIAKSARNVDAFKKVRPMQPYTMCCWLCCC